MAYNDLGKKRTKTSSARERSGAHGIKVEGLSVPATPHQHKATRGKSIPSKLDQMPGYVEDPFAMNPSLKGFLQAKPARGSEYFPVNPQHMKHDVTDPETRDR